MERINVQAIWEVKHREYYEKKKQFFEDWFKDKKCSCNTFICEHASAEARKVFVKEEAELKRIVKTMKVMDAIDEAPNLVPELMKSGYFE